MIKNSKKLSSLLHNFNKQYINNNNKYFSTTINIQNIKGTYDLFPKEKRIYNYIEETSKQIASRYGFQEISTPIIEPFELFNRSVGENSDIVMKEMFSFKEHASSSSGSNSNTICLRPEGTAGVIRAIINEGSTNQNSPTQRYYYKGPMFRYERPQRGRQRQFHQIGVELIGDQHPLSDVELIDMAINFIESLKINGRVTLKINSLGDIDSINSYNQILNQFYNQHFDQLSIDSKNRLQRNNSLRILDSKDPSDIKLNKSAPLLSNHLNQYSKNRFDQVLKGLDNLNISYEIDQSLVRGLDYYRHTIFEIQVDQQDSNNSTTPALAILGGGRYDGLANQLGYKRKEILPSIGWACGVDRIVLYMNENQVPKDSKAIGIVTNDSSLSTIAFQTCSKLRKIGYHCMLSTYRLDEDNVSKQFKKINREESPDYVIIFAPKEMESNSIIIKNMLNSEQSILPLNEIDNFFKNLK